jgi:iron complex transport system substrate-binding protein
MLLKVLRVLSRLSGEDAWAPVSGVSRSSSRLPTVIPAKAGIHTIPRRSGNGMDSRLRGNDDEGAWRRALWAIHFALCLPLLALSAHARTIVDMSGRSVEIPDRIERVACLEVICYPRMFMLGEDAKIVTMYASSAPWTVATNPRSVNIPSYRGDPNLEELAVLKPDVAFIRYNPEQALPRLKALGIPGLVSQPYPREPQSLDEFLADMKTMVRLFGQVLGGEAEKRAEDWCAYFDERARFLTSRVSGIPAEGRARVYYVRGPEAVSTQGKGGYTYWSGKLAGADMVVDRALSVGKGAVSMEDLIRWNPEVVLVGRQYPLEVVTGDARWRDITAVVHHKVVSTPEGVWYWDGGPEIILQAQFIAKTIYPDRFADFDMATELKAYYARFYRVTLSDDDAAKILSGRAPDGSRVNTTNE